VSLYITEREVDELLSPTDARIAVEASLDRIARGAVDNPTRVRSELPGGVFAVMPCVDRELGYAGLKTYAWLPAGTPFLVVLFSIERAELEAVVEADLLGQRRTAAASAVAAQRLARRDASTLGMVGCGRQAAAHVVALREALPSLEAVLVTCRDQGRLEEFCAAHECEPAAPAEVGACEIVVTATTSTEPVLHGAWLRPGATVIAIGANDLGSRELDDAVLARAAFVCTDSVEQARQEAGDLVAVDDLYELHDVHARERDDDIVVFKSNGLAAWDLAAAAAVVTARRARR
jgi:ornithine cyclodeaminase/alanine dehydrogenase-like protein (mu-crystallin family)